MAYYAVLCDRGFVRRGLHEWASRTHHWAAPGSQPVPGVGSVLGHPGFPAIGTALGLRAQGLARGWSSSSGTPSRRRLQPRGARLAAAPARRSVVVVDNRSTSYAVPGRIAARFATEGWSVTSVDGHDHEALEKALSERGVGVPNAVVATVPQSDEDEDDEEDAA